jgi:hypothetical protein
VDGAAFDVKSVIDAVLADLGGDRQDLRSQRATLHRLAAADQVVDSVDLRALTRLLTGEPEALWGTVLLRSTLYWYVIDVDGTHGGSIAAGDGSPLGDALREVADALPEPDNYGERVRDSALVMSRGPGARLSSVLLPPMIRRIWNDAAAAGRPQRLLYVPAAAIARLPIAALPLGAHREPLVQWIRPVYTPSPALASAVLGGPSPIPAGRPIALVVADPTGDLPGARRLANLGATSLSGKDATRANVADALRTAMRHTGPSATFVYAGHTTLPDDASRAVLHLADADLSAAEWLTAEGRREFRMPAAVVLLSCSSSGLGTADWYGLATAALAAGARTVVCSLWPHSDASANVDRRVIEAVAAGGDVVAAIYAVLDSFRSGRPTSITASPFVWANYAVISLEPPRSGEDRLEP